MSCSSPNASMVALLAYRGSMATMLALWGTP